MTLAIQMEPVPLTQESDGTVRVGGTRVLLDVVITSFRNGSSAEHIVEEYPLLDIADVYAVIAYYLKHHTEVDAYMNERRREAGVLEKEIKSKYGSEGIRERLLARFNARK